MTRVTMLNFIPGHKDSEYIVLPRQSPLGTFEGLSDQPTDIWPLTLLCLWHGNVFERSDDSVQLGPVPETVRTTGPTPLWLIEWPSDQGSSAETMRLFGYGDESHTEDHVRTLLVQAAVAGALRVRNFPMYGNKAIVKRLY